MKQAMTFFFFGDVIAVTNFSGKNLVPPQIGLSSYAHAFKPAFPITSEKFFDIFFHLVGLAN